MDATVNLLICPGCRTATADRIDVRTLDRDGEFLVCECGRRYPVIDGVPIMHGASDVTAHIERDLDPDVAAALVAGGTDDAPYARLLEHLSIYLDAHWGDGMAPFLERIRALPRVGTAVELGCSVGRVVAEMPADDVYGVDLQFAAVRRAKRLLAGEPVAYARRMIGRSYERAVAKGIKRAATVVCGDALDAPFVPGAFDRVVALNLLDSVPHPRQLIAVVDALCAPGGEILLSSPYAWQSNVMAEDERFGGADPAAALVEMLTGRGFTVVDEAELPWTLRRDARSTLIYRSHYVRARKGT